MDTQQQTKLTTHGAFVPGKVGGFTLMELMIVVAIVAILAGIAFASYQGQIIKSRRSAAANCLQERAQFVERYYTTNLTYVGATAGQCDNQVSPHYQLAISGLTAKSFTLTATPLGQQLARDTLCGALSVDARGTRGKTGSASTVAECW